MIEPAGRMRLVEEQLAKSLAVFSGEVSVLSMCGLDGDRATRERAIGLVDRAHAAASDLPDNLVLADFCRNLAHALVLTASGHAQIGEIYMRV